MTVNDIKNQLADHLKDVKLNLSTVLTEEGSPGLSSTQIWGTALACAYATRHQPTVDAIKTESQQYLSAQAINAAQAAASIMAMNNVYYRFSHMVEDKEFTSMPAKLRMSVLANPGVDKVAFEMMSLAVSAINGCGACVNAHVAQLKKAGLSNEAIQSSVRLASVMTSVAQALMAQNS